LSVWPRTRLGIHLEFFETLALAGFLRAPARDFWFRTPYGLLDQSPIVECILVDRELLCYLACQGNDAVTLSQRLPSMVGHTIANNVANPDRTPAILNKVDLFDCSF
jgi:hypothetical protein